jgi:hypothetical protein
MTERELKLGTPMPYELRKGFEDEDRGLIEDKYGKIVHVVPELVPHNGNTIVFVQEYKVGEE